MSTLYEENWKLVAPDIDRLEGCFDRGFANPSGPVKEVNEAIEPLFAVLKDLAPLEKNEYAKSIWIKVPRGTIDDFGSFEDYQDEYIQTKEDFEKYWLQEYPDEYKWYQLTIVEEFDRSGDLYFRGVGLGNKTIVSIRYDDEPTEKDWTGRDDIKIILCRLLTEAAKESMDLLKAGKYNDMVEKELPYQHKTGVVRRADEWKVFPEARESIWEGLSEETYQKFKKLIENGENDEGKIGRMKRMTANDFFMACSLGYKACGYDVLDDNEKELPLWKQYLRFADGRDEGLTGTGYGLNEGPGIDFDDTNAWDDWYFDRSRFGGHPWEVCRGGNSTHIDLHVCHDKNHYEWQMKMDGATEEEIEEAGKDWGYYFSVAGKSWGRSVEAINFYVAIHDAGYPVVLSDGKELLKRLEGEGYTGIVPWDIFPRYCEGLFPAKYGEVLDFMHVWPKEYKKLKDYIEWLPVEKAELSGK